MKSVQKVLCVVVIAGLTACSEGNTTATPQAIASSKTVFEAIAERDLTGAQHGNCENAAFYAAVGNMTTPSQVQSYYQNQGFNMSPDGSGGAAIAALTGAPFSGRMAGKAACFSQTGH